jgi:hypothetical protein
MENSSSKETREAIYTIKSSKINTEHPDLIELSGFFS